MRFTTKIVVLALASMTLVVASPLAAGASTIVQGTPMMGSTDVAGSSSYADFLMASMGSSGTVTFTTSTPDFTVVNDNELETTQTLSAGDYTVNGDDSDGNGDSGTWTYQLTVASDPITQSAPFSGSTDVAGSAAFNDTLAASPGFTDAVTFTTNTTGFTIVGGDELESTGPLSANDSPYTVMGSDTDAYGDSGTWTYQLTVAGDPITQSAPFSGSTNVAGSADFNDTLAASPGFADTVTFTTSTPGFTIVGGDELKTTGTLSAAASPYTVSGNDSDASGDSGTWSYQLTVAGDSITQGLPSSGSTSTADSATFSTTLSAASGFTGPVTFTTSTPGFTIAGGDELETTGTLSAAGSPYTVTGSDSDAYGDTGTWSYVLSVESILTTASLTQTSSKTGTVSTASSGTFTAGPITVSGNNGAVTFVTTSSNAGLTVSASGLISTTGSLEVGTYSVSGTDVDTHGDSGSWTYTLNVTAAPVSVTVTFDANGGKGTMAPESASAPTALTLNGFVRSGYSFVDWNTKANGSGESYANGDQYTFAKALTLFAQWKLGKAPERTINFRANGGTGATAPEVENTPTAIRENSFTRAGYTFVDWNTKANGSGESFKSGSTYSFAKSLILYAQWKKIPKPPTKKPTPHDVTFLANGGSGAMAVERHDKAAALTPNHFRRNGYAFVDWNTQADGSGTSYANGARYSFGASVTLYAQWKKTTPVSPPTVISGGVTIGHFALGSSSLSSGLESQIQSLASEIKAKGDKQITLYGFGDQADSATSATLDLGRQRAESVVSYLGARLVALGFKGWTISIAPESGNQSEVGTVIAVLS